MNMLSFLTWAEFVIPIAIDSVLLYYFVLAYRRTKLRPFALWIFSFIVNTILLLARLVASFCYVTSREILIISYAAYDILWMASLVVFAIAFVMLIRHLLSEHEKKSKAAA